MPSGIRKKKLDMNFQQADINALLATRKMLRKGVFFMSIKKVSPDVFKIYETSQVKLKTAGNIREIQFTAGTNNHCPIQNTCGSKELQRLDGETYESVL